MKYTINQIDTNGEATGKGRDFYILPRFTPRLRRDIVNKFFEILDQQPKEAIEAFRKTKFDSTDLLKILASYMQWLNKNGYAEDFLSIILIPVGKKYSEKTALDILETKSYISDNIGTEMEAQILSDFFITVDDQTIVYTVSYIWQTIAGKINEAIGESMSKQQTSNPSEKT